MISLMFLQDLGHVGEARCFWQVGTVDEEVNGGRDYDMGTSLIELSAWKLVYSFFVEALALSTVLYMYSTVHADRYVF